jgi:hypothetical protein
MPTRKSSRIDLRAGRAPSEAPPVRWLVFDAHGDTHPGPGISRLHHLPNCSIAEARRLLAYRGRALLGLGDDLLESGIIV